MLIVASLFSLSKKITCRIAPPHWLVDQTSLTSLYSILMSDAALIISELDLTFCSRLQVSLKQTHPAQQCLRNSKRTARRLTTSSLEVISIGLCWCLEVSDCTPTNRSQCFWGRTPTSQMDTEPTCPPDCASKGEKQSRAAPYDYFHYRLISWLFSRLIDQSFRLWNFKKKFWKMLIEISQSPNWQTVQKVANHH